MDIENPIMGEIVITDSIPDLDTRQMIEGYLAHKWGIADSLPGDHPHKINPPGRSMAAPGTLIYGE